jgi:nucleotide-binding universal stress UspA family protein
MAKQILFGLDGSERAYQALQNLGTLLEPTDLQVHLFYAAPESALFYPGELSTLSGEPGQWKKAQENQAQAVLGRAVDVLSKQGLIRSRMEEELKLKSVNAAQEILAAGERQASSVVALAPKGRSAVKRFFLGSTTALVCQYAENLPVWVIGNRPLKPPHLLAAIDESFYAERVIAHIGEYFGKLPGTRVTLFQVIPAKPPGYWDDGHILDESERSERQKIVKNWRAAYEKQTEDLFLKAKSRLAAAGVPQEDIAAKCQTMVEGIARDILAEAGQGDYNILAFGRRGSSAIKEFTLGSRAAKLLQNPFDHTLIVVN